MKGTSERSVVEGLIRHKDNKHPREQPGSLFGLCKSAFVIVVSYQNCGWVDRLVGGDGQVRIDEHTDKHMDR